MAFSKTPHANALSTGAELWVLPDLESSSWTQIIDWYVNFQFSKAGLHRTRALPIHLERIIEENNTDLFRFHIADTAPLFIATERLLPAQQAVVVHYDGDVAKWTERAEKVWSQLHHPKVRVFLPDQIQSDDFVSAWQETPENGASMVTEN